MRVPGEARQEALRWLRFAQGDLAEAGDLLVGSQCPVQPTTSTTHSHFGRGACQKLRYASEYRSLLPHSIKCAATRPIPFKARQAHVDSLSRNEAAQIAILQKEDAYHA